MDVRWLLWLVPIGVGVLLVVSVDGWMRDRRLRRYGIRTTAKVVALNHGLVFDGETYTDHENPVVRFTLPDGRVVTAEARRPLGVGVSSVGTEVSLYYDPHDPTRVLRAWPGTPVRGHPELP